MDCFLVVLLNTKEYCLVVHMDYCLKHIEYCLVVYVQYCLVNMELLPCVQGKLGTEYRANPAMHEALYCMHEVPLGISYVCTLSTSGNVG